MKVGRFHFTISVSSLDPAGLDSEQWPRERTPFLHSFLPIAQRYRRRRRTGLYLFVGFMVGGFSLMYLPLPEPVRFQGFLLLAATWFAMVSIFAFGLRLRCPSCRKRLKPAKGSYCPQCGSARFRLGFHYGGCDGRIVEEDADSERSYRIRGCTHCGVMLDERGV